MNKENEYTRKWKTYEDFINSNTVAIERLTKYFFKEGQFINGKFYTTGMFEEMFFKLWFLSEDDFYLREGNENFAFGIISFTSLIDIKIMSYFREVVENQEARLTNWHIILSSEILNLLPQNQSDLMKKNLNHEDKFNSSGRRFHSIKKIVNNNGINKKIDLKLIENNHIFNQCELFVNEFEDFIIFRNKVVHTENRLYHILISDVNRNNPRYEDLYIARNYISKNLSLRDEDYEEIDFTFNKIISNIKTQKFRTEILNKIENDLSLYIKLIIEMLGLKN